LREIKGLIDRRRTAAQTQFGNWPVEFDLQGTMLPIADRPDFQRRGAAAATNGHAVVAIELKDRWWIYDDTVAVPAFAHAVTVNLTPDDLIQIKRQWALLAAEVWARTEDRKPTATEKRTSGR
jgi:hypothetical protein